jgi:hypothetical protein
MLEDEFHTKIGKPKLYYWLKVLFSPSYWIMNNDYDREWDNELLEMMENPEIVDSFYIRLNGKLLWITNWPYASLTSKNKKRSWRDSGSSETCRPSRATLMRFQEIMDRKFG